MKKLLLLLIALAGCDEQPGTSAWGCKKIVVEDTPCVYCAGLGGSGVALSCDWSRPK